MRGLRWVRDLTGGKVRYNPAYAGTTYAPQGVADTAAIQPRVCGDYCCKLKRNRYNPAYAGTTSCPRVSENPASIQPRVCGDYEGFRKGGVSTHDTTPRMRGLLTKHPPTRAFLRYNPAYAGTTGRGVATSRKSPIQPRVCGDYFYCWWRTDQHVDTTPRMRGLRNHRLFVLGAERYNPAYAGTTLFRRQFLFLGLIQPRVCGDYPLQQNQVQWDYDTTPRMRGLRIDGGVVEFQLRYNPAYAGTTPGPTTYGRPASIQPRVCGDYAFQSVARSRTPDTTPRMRGLLINRVKQRARR